MSSNKTFDAAIIGGGVIGCAIAWSLTKAGLSAAIIERNDLGCEASRAAGGMLAPFAEADERNDFLELAIASRNLYADFARKLKVATSIDIEYRTEGTLYFSFTEEDDEELERRWEWQHAAGLNTERLDAKSVQRYEPVVNSHLRWALRFPEDYQVNNRRMMIALGTAVRLAGVEILAYTEAQHLLIERQQVIGVATTRGEVRARIVIIAAGCWSSLLASANTSLLARARIEPVRGQMIALAMPTSFLRHVIYSRRGYLIPRFGGYLIAGSTSERVGYDPRVTAGGIASIIKCAIEILPVAENLPIIETWAGLRPCTSDALPILGADPQISGLIYATGHYRNGILLAPVTAEIVSELVVRGESRCLLKPFSIARFACHAVAD